MDSHPLLPAVVGVCLLNGLFSPLKLAVMGMAPAWYPSFLPMTPTLMVYFSSLILSTVTLMVAGVPAALYERITGATDSTNNSMIIWLVGCGILSLPALAALG